MKGCGTCIHIKRRCNGECSSCEHRIESGKANNPSVSYADTSLYTREAILCAAEFGCKCLECRDEESGRYKYYEEDKSITELLNDDED